MEEEANNDPHNQDNNIRFPDDERNILQGKEII